MGQDQSHLLATGSQPEIGSHDAITLMQDLKDIACEIQYITCAMQCEVSFQNLL